MILEHLAPRCDAIRSESRVFDAPPGLVYQAMLNTDLLDAARQNIIVRALRLLSIPRRGEWVKLGEDAPRAFAFGAIGRFRDGKTVWREMDAAEFAGFSEPGYAKIACRMLTEPYRDGRTRLTYEVRTIATDDEARRGFLRYWRVVSPMVGYIMRATLAAVARTLTVQSERDMLLNRFMPEYDIVERHSIRIAASAGITFAAAQDMDLVQSPVVRAIIKAREWILGARNTERPVHTGLVAQTRAMGWGLLDEVPGRELVMGAITQPWAANVVFRAIPPAFFARHGEPEHVKIAWTLRADAVDDATSVFRTETRAVACDDAARVKFRRYWRIFSPGIVLIRLAMLSSLKREAERRARAAHAGAVWSS